MRLYLCVQIDALIFFTKKIFPRLFLSNSDHRIEKQNVGKPTKRYIIVDQYVYKLKSLRLSQ